MPGSSSCLHAVIFCTILLHAPAVFGTAAAPSEGHGSPEEPTSNMGGGGGLLPHMEEPSSSDNSDLDFVKRLYDFGLGKRAYSYVSEYKRLPVYNFGLGKRSKMYGFGLGKRAGADSRLYSFGLGKRDYDDYLEEEDGDEQMSGDDEIDLSDTDNVDLMDKRERLYSFGLGKRARPYSFGLGKRSPSSNRLYSFGLGKRGGSMYSFGLGKRADGRLYAFGLGKRPVNSGRLSGSRFNFGLGKRSEDIDLKEIEDEILDEAKRSPSGHRFSFGLGKREVAPSELEAIKTEEQEREMKREVAPSELEAIKTEEQEKEMKHKEESSPIKKNETDDSYHHSGERVKRSLHYAFGLGKRGSTSVYDMDSSSSLDSEEDEDIGGEEFARLIRRPYNFGIGKRIPMYDFGIGKRSEH